MNKSVKLLGFVGIIILSGALGATIFGYVAYKNMWHPVPVAFTNQNLTGVSLEASVYEGNALSSWWEKGNGTLIKLWDNKNDSPVFRTIVHGNNAFDSITLMHSGEKFAVVNVLNNFYILHRIPRAMGKEYLEHWLIPAHGLAVAPDESGLFVYTAEMEKDVTITKYGWDKKIVTSINFPYISGVLEQPTFFANGNKLAFKQGGAGEQPMILYIWDLQKNTVEQFSGNDKTEIGKYMYQDLYSDSDGHLYIYNDSKKILVQ